MKIKQKKLSNKHTFTFEEDYFNFSFKDKSGSDDFDLNYADFPSKSSISIEQNEWLRNVGFLWCLIGIYSIGSALYNNLSLSGTGLWLFLGIICIVVFAFTKVKYSVFKTEQGNVFVINDSSHEKIISEINSRKKEQLLKWYGDINFENDPETEINKFNWLVKEKVISQAEAEKKIAQIELSLKNQDIKSNVLN